jgi:subtilase family serine protease
MTVGASDVNPAVSAGASGARPLIGHVWHGQSAAPPTIQQCLRLFGVKCYQPSEIRAAYNLPFLYGAGVTGAGRTIVIVDSYGSPTIGADLATFDAQFGINAPPSFQVFQPVGPVPPFDPSNGTMVSWAFETTLDVEWAHTVAPGANIVLLESPVAETEGIVGVPQMVDAMNWAINHHIGDVISQSWGATEQTFKNAAQLKSQRSAYLNARAHGVTVLASSGDFGAASPRFSGASFYPFPAIGWPAADPLVTAVGGTFLDLNASGDRLKADVTAADGSSGITSGSGRSSVFERPKYQDGVTGIVGDTRGIPDISMSGACKGAVLVYDTFFGAASWDAICGTSESSPLFSGIVALAGQLAGHRLGFVNPALYELRSQQNAGIVDVTKGNTTVTVCTANCSGSNRTITTVKGFPALDGYDLATGVGTVNAPAFVVHLAQAAG